MGSLFERAYLREYPAKRVPHRFERGRIKIGGCINIYISLVMLIAAAVMDLRSHRIWNEWICLGLVSGTLLMFLPHSILSWGQYAAGLLLALLVGWIPFRMHGIGAGDVKLFLVIGCLNGGRDVFYCIFFSFLLAAGISLLRLLRLRQLKQSLTYCILYFQSIFVLKKIEAYPGRYQAGHTIHFSVMILGGYVIWLGVKGCSFMPWF